MRQAWDFPGGPEPYERRQPDWRWLGIWFLAACCAFWIILGFTH